MTLWAVTAPKRIVHGYIEIYNLQSLLLFYFKNFTNHSGAFITFSLGKKPRPKLACPRSKAAEGRVREGWVQVPLLSTWLLTPRGRDTRETQWESETRWVQREGQGTKSSKAGVRQSRGTLEGDSNTENDPEKPNELASSWGGAPRASQVLAHMTDSPSLPSFFFPGDRSSKHHWHVAGIRPAN